MLKRKSFSPYQIIAIGYIIVIVIGSLLLLLPIASKSGEWSNYLDALFTTTSATCVTGLVVHDTYTQWSTFGQIVILILIQIGGIGFMTIISSIGIFLNKKINLHERKIIMQASGSIGISGIINLVKRIGRCTIIFEGIGAIILTTRFAQYLPLGKSMYFAVFHSISAFCNAGFDLMGGLSGEFTSLTFFANDWIINLTLIVLIISGGLGFLVWSDIIKNKIHFKKMKLHTKLVLSITAILIVLPTFLFLIFERNELNGLPWYQQIYMCLFQSVTTRTAGFNTMDIGNLSESSLLLTIILMMIGGSPGSTAGGIKTTTFLILILSILFATKQRTNIVVGKRQLEKNIVKQASAIFSLYLICTLVATMLILAFEPNSTISSILFESTSAIATVGLTTGITPTLCGASKIILMLLMYIGRIGALSIIFLFNKKDDNELLQRPVEKILIG